MIKKRTRLMLFSALLLLAACAGSLLAGRHWLQVTEYTISDPELPDGFVGCRIVQLSDLHGTRFGEGSARLLKKVRAQEPDIIVLTGDFIDRDTDMTVIEELMPGLAGIAPVYFISGNHDVVSEDFPEFETILSESGVVFLRGEYVTLRRGGDEIVLAGIEDPATWGEIVKATDIVDIIAEDKGDIFTILLAHRNYWPERQPELGVDIILCGHEHGGMIRLPVIGGLLSTDRTLFPDYAEGVTKTRAYSMVVSRGLGSSAGIPRFMNRPEIVTVVLEK